MINKKTVMYHNFLNDLDVMKAMYSDVSDEIKNLLERASNQAQMELRKEEKKNERKSGIGDIKNESGIAKISKIRHS